MSVSIEIVANRIWLLSAGPTPGLGKDVPGSSFSMKPMPHWACPLTIEACRQLRKRFGKALEIGPELTAWARAEVAREEQMGELGRAADADLARVPDISPVLAKAMGNRTYQRVGARFIASGRQVLIADEPGLGKTLEAIGGIIESGMPGPYLVVAPKTAVLSVWAEEIPRWWPGAQAITVPDGRAKRDDILNGLLAVALNPGTDRPGGFTLQQTFLVVHPEMLRTKSFWHCRHSVDPFISCEMMTPVKAFKELECGHDARKAKRVDQHEFDQIFAIEWGAVVLDESDRMLVRKTGRSTQVRTGAELLKVHPDGLRVAMSGTPFRSRPEFLWGTLNWLRPKAYTSYWRWAEEYFEVTAGYGTSRNIGAVKFNKEQALYRSLDSIMLRRTKAEVAQDMPAKTYVGTPLDHTDESSPVGVWLPMDPQQEKAYRQMEAESIAMIEGGTLNAIGVLAEYTRLKQFATSTGRILPGQVFKPALPSNKLGYVMELCEELGIGTKDPSTKLIIVSQFTQILGLFAEVLDKLHGAGTTCLLTGEVSNARRPNMIKVFNEPAGTKTPHVMLLQVKTGGVALTIDSADHMVFLDETWVRDEQIQAEDRIHRVSKPRPVFYHYLRSRDTIETDIAAVNAMRGAASAALLDGRRGVKLNARNISRLKGVLK